MSIKRYVLFNPGLILSGTDASRNVADGMPAELQADAVVALWTQHMLIQEKKPELVRLLDTRAPEVMLWNPT